MTDRIFLKPAPLVIDGEPAERKVRKPVGTYLARDGEEVNLDTYWRRRLIEGEVVEAEPTGTEAVASTPESPAPAPASKTLPKPKA